MVPIFNAPVVRRLSNYMYLRGHSLHSPSSIKCIVDLLKKKGVLRDDVNGGGPSAS